MNDDGKTIAVRGPHTCTFRSEAKTKLGSTTGPVVKLTSEQRHKTDQIHTPIVHGQTCPDAFVSAVINIKVHQIIRKFS